MLLPDSLADQAAALRSPKDSIVDFLETLFSHDIEYAKRLLDTVQRFLIGSETGVECNVRGKDNNISFACRGGITKVQSYKNGYRCFIIGDPPRKQSFQTKYYGEHGAAILACLAAQHAVSNDAPTTGRARFTSISQGNAVIQFSKELYGDQGARSVRDAAKDLQDQHVGCSRSPQRNARSTNAVQ
eukprot:Lankesteria_metandrocarpae@DN5438_c0_g3_i2.p1